MINSPLTYFGPNSKLGYCEAAVTSTVTVTGRHERQCSAQAKTKRVFSDGQEHACCGQHARQYDKLLERVKFAEAQRGAERELIERIAALNVEGAELHYTLTGKPTNRVLVDIDVLERILHNR